MKKVDFARGSDSNMNEGFMWTKMLVRVYDMIWSQENWTPIRIWHDLTSMDKDF